tara:strand:- start:229 stop:423 length:195 start_codon:yes stop_codon:yes gene_type:complete
MYKLTKAEAYMGIEITKQFQIDPKLSADENFHFWYMENTQERLNWGDEPYSSTEARKVFDSLYK